MPPTLDLQAVENDAKEILEARMQSVRNLAAARNHVTDKTDELTAAETADKTAYDAALRAGWTPEELRKVGLAALTKTTTRTNTRTSTKTTGKTAGKTTKSAARATAGSDSDPGSPKADGGTEGASGRGHGQ